MSVPPDFLAYVDNNVKLLIEQLTEAVAIPSVSADESEAGREHVFEMAKWVKKQLLDVGVQESDLRSVDLGPQEGTNLQLPPAILARIGDDSKKKNVLVYCHYDVQPASKDGWVTEDPFKLTPMGDKLIGRGATDDKGPIVGWLTVLRYHKEKGIPLPVNLRFCFEGMEESGDGGALDRLVAEESKEGGWLYGVNAAAVADTWWLNTRKPTLTYGTRGGAYFTVTVSGPKQDLHSGSFGGMIFEPLTELVYLMSKLVDVHGHILIDGVGHDVKPPDDQERELYEGLDYSIEEIDQTVGASITLSDDKADVLMGKMRNPCLSLHGIEGAWTGPGTKTIIPSKVTGHFSLRLVPPQNADEVAEMVKRYIFNLHEQLQTKLDQPVVKYVRGVPAWVADKDDWHFEAAENAVKEVYDQSPDLVREGGSVPIILAFAHEIKGGSVIALSMGRGDDNAHSTNEKLNLDNFIKGTKLYGAYLYQVANAPSPAA